MKLMHLSDLHLGKRLNEFSLIDDQKDIIIKILNIIDDKKVDGVIIAGDVYDKSIASAEAVKLFDDFLSNLARRNLKVFVISGNHDSAERIAFGNRIMDNAGVYLSPVYNGNVKQITLDDEYGNVNIYLLPYVRPSIVRKYFEDEEILSYTDAMEVVIKSLDIDTSTRNVLICHQFVTGASRSDSEDISVGGLDNVNSEVFKDFDYVALGHIHNPQNIKTNIRYCGTPLKYSFSEANNIKTVTIVDLNKKGDIKIEEVPLQPLRDLREIKGNYEHLVSKEYYQDTNKSDYLHITLTDEEEIYDAMAKLRTIYPNIMKLDYDNKRTRKNQLVDMDEEELKKSPLELFNGLYNKQNNADLNDKQKEFLQELIDSIWRE